MKTKIFFLLLMAVLVACQKEEPTSNSGGKNSSGYTILYKQNSPYLEWFLGNEESFVSYILRDYPINEKGEYHKRVKGNEDNTITLNNNVSICIHDDYTFANDSDQTGLSLTRKATINQVRELNLDSTFVVPSATPITLIRPQVDRNHAIPMCYYKDFEIEWNGDETNNNGVVIIAEWNGGYMRKEPELTTYACVDIVEDKGITVLKTELFDKIPDEALVNLWLIRGNLVSYGQKGTLDMNELAKHSQDEIAEQLNRHPEWLLQIQPFILGSGAVTTFSFFLIKE